MRLAHDHQTVVRMERGDFVVRDTPPASLRVDSPPEKEIIAVLQAAYSLNRYRTVEQDAGFGISVLCCLSQPNCRWAIGHCPECVPAKPLG